MPLFFSFFIIFDSSNAFSTFSAARFPNSSRSVDGSPLVFAGSEFELELAESRPMRYYLQATPHPLRYLDSWFWAMLH